ncbi:HNH endonuclease [Bacillus cereus]|uniref:HNH endonuclease n=1 Tax=Bacillus cereus TaxID=1396 RepID=UPI0018CE520C|nr:HNH endonuclease [Bacillus cereus]MBG9716499.1 Anaredoxin [Bacillus cereus]
MSNKRDYRHTKSQKLVKEMDAYMCFFCFEVNQKSHGHHIIYFSEDGSSSVHNMITLCPTCHRLYHSGKLKLDIGRF